LNSQLTAFITLICTSGVLNLYLCANVFLKRHRYKNIAQFFILYSLSITIYCFSSAFGLTSTNLEQMKIWTIIQYVGMPISAPLGLLFIMYYLGMKITKKKLLAILTIPIISFVMVATNDFHHLHYKVFKIDPFLGAPYIHLEIGIWYAIHGIYTFGSMFVAFFLILSHWRDTAKAYRLQLVALLFGQFVPMLTAFLYLIGVTPKGIDPVPMVLWLTSLLYLWAINSSRMFSITPVAKDTIFNSINDGVIVLDESHQLIEYNQACQRMFPILNRSMLGLDFDKVWEAISGEFFPSLLESAVVTQEINLITNDSQRIYQVRTSSLHHANNSRGLLIIFTDITELKRLQVKLEHQAYYDELTGIFNRRAFFENCKEGFAVAKRGLLPYTVVLMDVDYFKKVNDTFGHPVGDQLLIHVAKVCQSLLADDMLFARYGGEEFVLALNGSSAVEGVRIANQLRMAVESHPLHLPEGIISVTLSCGVAEATAIQNETLYQLLNRADKALYLAKENGRNQVMVDLESENQN
jgi:diguanylate cyclase (GGDEF)-like protein/PAS domain S-box-containing protein